MTILQGQNTPAPQAPTVAPSRPANAAPSGVTLSPPTVPSAVAGTLPTPIPGSSGGVSRADLRVDAMHCAGCVATIERELSTLHGVAKVSASLSTHMVHVDFRASEVRLPEVLARLEAIGYPAGEGSPSAQLPVGAEAGSATKTAGGSCCS